MRAGAVLGIVLKEMKGLFRDRTSLFWVLVFPVLMYSLMAAIYGRESPVATIKMALVDLDEGGTPLNSSVLVRVLEAIEINGTRVFDLVRVGSEDEARELVRRGEVDAALVIPEDFGASLTFGTATLKLIASPLDRQEYQLVTGMVSEVIKRLSERIADSKIDYMMNLTVSRGYVDPVGAAVVRGYLEGIATPIRLEVEEVVPRTGVRLAPLIKGWMLMSVAVTVMVYSGMFTGATLVVEEREKGTLARIAAAPISPWDLLAGKVISATIAVLMAIAELAVLAIYGFGARVAFDPSKYHHWLAVLSLVPGTIITVSMGLLVSLPCRSLKGAEGLASSVAWPMMFLTGIWIPELLLPPALRLLGRAFPPRWIMDSLIAALVRGRGPDEVVTAFIKVIAATAAFFVAAVLAYRYNLRRMLEA